MRWPLATIGSVESVPLTTIAFPISQAQSFVVTRVSAKYLPLYIAECQFNITTVSMTTFSAW
jgi:hypothetical protein